MRVISGSRYMPLMW